MFIHRKVKRGKFKVNLNVTLKSFAPGKKLEVYLKINDKLYIIRGNKKLKNEEIYKVSVTCFVYNIH